MTVYLKGIYLEAPPYAGIADMRIVYTIYGVAAFVLIVICVSCFFCIRCLYRSRQAAKEKPPSATAAPRETEGLITEKKTEPPVQIHR